MGQDTREGTKGFSQRLHTSVLLLVTFLWQSWIVLHAFRSAAAMRKILEGLGAELPLITTWFLASYKCFVVVPVATLVLAVLVLRMRILSPWWPTAAVAFGLLSGFILHAWATEAFFAPLLSLINQIG